VRGAALTVILNPPGITAGLLDWSTTCTVKFDVPPLPVGVPEITPAALIVSPAGSDPPEIENVFVPVPPATTTVAVA
jgi:hypothetical protein